MKYILLLTLLITCFSFSPTPISAVGSHHTYVAYQLANNTPDASAHFENGVSNSSLTTDIRISMLTDFLHKYRSPLEEHVNDLITAADMYGLDYRLLPAISGKESGFCAHIPKGSFNCWGWNNGNYKFLNYKTAIYTIARALRLNYINKGYKTLGQINGIYAPPSSTWADGVGQFMLEIDKNTKPYLLLQITI